MFAIGVMEDLIKRNQGLSHKALRNKKKSLKDMYVYMLQGICETSKYAYFLKLSVNTCIP